MDLVTEKCRELTKSRWDAERVLPRLGALVDAILEANRHMNLTADGEPDLFWVRHVEDALWTAWLLEDSVGRPGAEDRLLDVGSGAGLPGLVLAILWPEAQIDLLEARRRRADFLKSTAESLGLGRVRVLEGRAETLAHQDDHREKYNVVTARAVAPMPTLLELTLPFARLGGVVAAVKSADAQEELRSARTALATLGAGQGPLECLPYQRSDGKACQVCLARKMEPTPGLYPRRCGVPERKPLI